MPPGWTAGPILWPAPILLRDKSGNIVGHGYEGDTLLPVVLTPPAALEGFAVELKAKADWLMCETICVPGGNGHGPMRELGRFYEAMQRGGEWNGQAGHRLSPVRNQWMKISASTNVM